MTGAEAEQLVVRFFDALARLDADAAAELVSDDYEGYAADEIETHGEHGIYRGRDGIRAWIGEIRANWQGFKTSVARMRTYGDVIVVNGVYEVEMPGNPIGQIVQQRPVVSVVRVHDGLISSIHAYTQYADAARAEGLPTTELGPGST